MKTRFYFDFLRILLWMCQSWYEKHLYDSTRIIIDTLQLIVILFLIAIDDLSILKNKKNSNNINHSENPFLTIKIILPPRSQVKNKDHKIFITLFLNLKSFSERFCSHELMRSRKTNWNTKFIAKCSVCFQFSLNHKQTH